MKALPCIDQAKFAILDKPKPVTLDFRDAVVRVTLEAFAAEICTRS